MSQAGDIAFQLGQWMATEALLTWWKGWKGVVSFWPVSGYLVTPWQSRVCPLRNGCPTRTWQLYHYDSRWFKTLTLTTSPPQKCPKAFCTLLKNLVVPIGWPFYSILSYYPIYSVGQKNRSSGCILHGDFGPQACISKKKVQSPKSVEDSIFMCTLEWCPF